MTNKDVPGSSPLLQVENLKKHYHVESIWSKQQIVKAVDGISFSVMAGTTLGIVGESGCGKSTAGRAILNLDRPTMGKVIFEGEDIVNTSQKEWRDLRRKMQLVFQDPFAALNGRKHVKDLLAEPFKIHHIANGKELTNLVMELLDMVGLPHDSISKYPHEFSGGQRQRLVIARAIALRPKLVVCDEPVSALDVSVQSQIVNLFKRLQVELKLTYLFISHDLSIVRHMSDEVGVMYLGKMSELASTEEIFQHPLHPYTKALLSAAPIPDPLIQRHRERIILNGDLPSPIAPPAGCRFHTRCPFAESKCMQEEPMWREASPNHWVACHLAGAE